MSRHYSNVLPIADHTWTGVTDPAKVMGVDKTNIAKVKGVASA